MCIAAGFVTKTASGSSPSASPRSSKERMPYSASGSPAFALRSSAITGLSRRTRKARSSTWSPSNVRRLRAWRWPMLPRPAMRTFKPRSEADAPQPLHDGLLALVDALLAVALRALVQTNVPDEPAEALRLDGGSVVGSPRGPVERDVPLHHAGTENDGGKGRSQADLVAGVADRYLVALGEPLDDAQVELVRARGVGARRVQQDEVLAPEQVDCTVDLLQRAHAGGEDDRSSLGPRVLEQGVIGQAGRGDLVARRIEVLDEVDGALVPARGEPGHAHVAAEGVDLLVLVEAELEPLAVLRVGDQTPGGLSGKVALLGRHTELRRALLKLHRLRAGAGCRPDELLRQA